MSVLNRDPQHWAYLLDRVCDDSHEAWMWRWRIAQRLWG